MKIYIASSWKNEYYEKVLKIIKKNGHDIYDFRNPSTGNKGFHWSTIDKDWKGWTTGKYRKALEHPIVHEGFNSDFNAMEWADCCVLLLPAGKSAHTEAGWMKGKGKNVYIFMPEKQEPELMYKNL
jgi:hypothetical protein